MIRNRKGGSNIKNFELQPLRIPAGWYIKYNMFSEYDPDTDGREYSYELCEDLLQLEHEYLMIDLGWYPQSDINGSYKLYLVDTSKAAPFYHPLEVFSSRLKKEIIYMIEYWTDWGFYGKYLHR